MHPFVFNQHSAAERQQATEVPGVYTFMISQYSNADLLNTQVLLSTDTFALPQLFPHGRGMVKWSMVWFATFLGARHDVVEGNHVFLEMWLTKKAEYKLLVPRDVMMRTLVPTLFVRWFQICFTVWIQA